MEEKVKLDNGPNLVSERRVQTPVCNVPMKRRSDTHDEEPDTKKIICGDLTDEELDMLDLAYGLTDTSRLGCQVCMSKELDGLVVKVPEGVNDQR